MDEEIDSPLATEADEHQVVSLVMRDLLATLGPGYENIARTNASRLRAFAQADTYVDRVVNDVQQQIHDECIDTSWPPCPRHPSAPLEYRAGLWWCGHDGQPVAALGALPACPRSNDQQVWGLQFSRPREDGGPQLSLGDPAIDPIFDEFWMLEGYRIPWSSTPYWLYPLFGYGFRGASIQYQSWWPGQQRKLSAFRTGIPGTYEENGGTIAGAVSPPFVLRRVLETRATCGGDSSGLWLLLAPRAGRTMDYDALARRGGSPLGVAVENRDSVLTALALDEGGLGTLLVHREHAERDRLSELKAWLSAQAK